MQEKTRHIASHARRLSQHTTVRFAAVGIINTLVDFGIFNILIAIFSLGVVPASITSTTIAMIISYLLNKKVVFRQGTPHSVRQVVLFFAVTISGIWIVQTLIMVQALGLLERAFDADTQSFLYWFLQNVAKGIGVVGSLTWNYIGYSRIVFRKQQRGES